MFSHTVHGIISGQQAVCGHCKHLLLYIHDCMSGFQSGFLDFKADFWISFEPLLFNRFPHALYTNRSPSNNYVISCNRFKFTQKHNVKINEYRGMWAILVQL